MTRTVRAAMLAAVVAGGAGPAPASAELVFLKTGRTLSVATYRVEGSQAHLGLRGGGEVVCAAALIVRVEADEVPWPTPPSPGTSEASSLPRPAAVPPFDDLIGTLARRHGVEAALVHAVVAAESAFEPTARSPKGAMGLMQLMPQTARQYAVEDPYDPGANLDAGIRHLKMLLGRYDIKGALAAYNAGEAAVQRHGGMPPFSETREYVARVLRGLTHYRESVGGPAGDDPEPTRPRRALPSS